MVPSPAVSPRLAVLLMACALCGCAHVRRSSSAAPALNQAAAPDQVSFEITSIRLPLGDPELGDALWETVDEQQIPLETRRRLAANGFRVGVVGTRLSPKIEQLIAANTAQAPEVKQEAAPGEPQPVDLEAEPNVRQRLVFVRSGRRTKIICTGEAQRHDELSVLMRDEYGEVTGRTYRKVCGLLSAKAFPLGDGRVRLELLPELEHGDPQRRFDPSEGMLRVEFGPPIERFDPLRIDVPLSAGQMLLLSAIPERPGSLGHHFFTEKAATRDNQKLLFVRVARSGQDDAFDDAPASSPGDSVD